ncbi:MAG: cysteine desulfurase family protein [Candidatus Saccharimonadales bacterium]
MPKTIYMDYAAATPMDDTVLAAMQPYFAQKFYNPSATYLAAKAVHADVEAARAKVAHWLGSRPSEIVFTAGGTEANNLAIQGVMRQFPDANLVVSAFEHDSVLEPARQFDHKIAKVSADGRLDLTDLEAKINHKTILVSVMYANNEIGTLQPLKEVAKIIDKIRINRQKQGNKLPIYLHTDACQAANYLDLHVDRLGVDLMTINGGKIYGPKQSGALYIKTGVLLTPQILGGGQENGHRSGTENVPAIIGLSTALDLAQIKRLTEVKRLAELQQRFVDKIVNSIKSASVNGSLRQRLPNNIHLTFPGVDNERLMMQLDEQGIMSAVGSACSASNEEPSHVLKAIGLSDADAQSSLRFTMGRSTTAADIDHTVKVLTELVGPKL